MSPSEINVAIAEWCGYSFDTTPDCHGNFWLNHDGNTLGGDCEPNIKKTLAHLVPNYHGNLNAIHEALKKLSYDQQYDFAESFVQNMRDDEDRALGERTGRNWQPNGFGYFKLLTAGSADLSKHLVRFLGLWREDKEGQK